MPRPVESGEPPLTDPTRVPSLHGPDFPGPGPPRPRAAVSVADALRRHGAGRAILAVARRARASWRTLRPVRRRLREARARGALALRALPALPRLAPRRARLRAALADLPPLDRAAGAHHEIFTITGRGPAPVEARSGDDDALVCVRSPTTEPLGDRWLERLAAAIGDGTVAAAPMLVHPARPLLRATPDDLLVRSLGLVLALESDAPVVRARAHGTPPDPHLPATPVDASSACLVVLRRAFEAAGGLAPVDDVDAAIVELCWRLRALGRVVVVPSSVVSDASAVVSTRMLASPVDASAPAWRAVVDLHGASMRRAASHEPRPALHVALTVAAPSAKVAPRWGDWHLADALARALRVLGVPTRVQTLDHADDAATRSCDVHVVLRGVARVRRTPGQRHVLWVISHPETIGADECDEADLVLVASQRFAEELRARTTTPVEVLLQATDHRRFRPLPPDPRHDHAIAVVAKTRDVLRPAVADALAAGLRPAIYGSGWQRFVEPGLVVAEHVDNDTLPTVYSSIGVLLNDHWESMRANGFVSNRIFDALACSTPVISDDLPEIAAIFGDAVQTYRTPDELRALVDAALADPDAARAKAAEGRSIVLAAHTFDHRAARLLEVFARHGLDVPPP